MRVSASKPKKSPSLLDGAGRSAATPRRFTPRAKAVHATETVIRPIEPRDLDELISLCREHAAFERVEYVSTGKKAALEQALFSSTPALLAWVAETGGTVSGYATATREFSTWAGVAYAHMDCLFVREAHRGKAVGAALLARVVDFARDHGLGEVQWQTPSWNENAARFYSRAGATHAAKLRFALRVPFQPPQD